MHDTCDSRIHFSTDHNLLLIDDHIQKGKRNAANAITMSKNCIIKIMANQQQLNFFEDFSDLQESSSSAIGNRANCFFFSFVLSATLKF